MNNPYDTLIDSYVKQLEKLVSSESYQFQSVERKQIPKQPGIYVIFNKSKELLYIGQSKNLQRRLIDDHLQNDKIGSAFRRNLSDALKLSSEKEITAHIRNNCYFKYMALDNPKNLEHFAIAVLTPKLNR